MIAKKLGDETSVFTIAEETTVFTNRGTGSTVPLNKYGRPGTFGLAVAEKLATTGLTEAEYTQFVQKMGKKKCISLKKYIKYFTNEGFNIVLENDRYVQKSDPACRRNQAGRC